jgi:hypothetical protein
MEISNENEVLPQEETYTKKEIEEGDVRIPVTKIMPYLFNIMSQSYGQRVGLDSDIGRNFLLLSHYNSRQKMEKVKGFQFLTPLVIDTPPDFQDPLPLVCMEPYTLEEGKSIFTIQILRPEYPKDVVRGQPTPNAVTELFTFFSETIRTREFELKGLTFAHIAASILQCIKRGYLHFNIQTDNETDTLKPGDTRWSFQCNKNELFIYPIVYTPPMPEREETFLSPWISSTIPCVKRSITPFKYYHFSEDDIQQLENDVDVQKILAVKGEEKQE